MSNETTSLGSISERLIWARQRAGLSQNEAAERTGISRKVIGAHEEGRNIKRGLTAAYAAVYGRVYGVSDIWLSQGRGDPVPTGRREAIRVPVVGVVQAGNWSETTERPLSERGEVWVNRTRDLEREVLYAVEVRGPSMNKVYPEGSVVVLRRRIEDGYDLVSGKRYHVERQRADGCVESTLKTLVRRHDGSLWLQPESTDPEFTAAIPVKPEAGTHISFVGRVVQAIIDE